MQTLTKKQQKVYDAFLNYPDGETGNNVAKGLGYTEYSYIGDCIKALIKKGYLVQIEKGRNAKYRVTQDHKAKRLIL